MDDKNKGLYQKYEVKKLTNPTKKIDAIVLEFDDPIAHEGIWAWAVEMREKGYYQVYANTIDKLNASGAKKNLHDSEPLKYHKHKPKEFPHKTTNNKSELYSK